jgi:hypothetical protein
MAFRAGTARRVQPADDRGNVDRRLLLGENFWGGLLLWLSVWLKASPHSDASWGHLDDHTVTAEPRCVGQCDRRAKTAATGLLLNPIKWWFNGVPEERLRLRERGRRDIKIRLPRRENRTVT